MYADWTDRIARRRAAAGAAAPAGHRAQPRADACGSGAARDVRARRAVDRQAQSHAPTPAARSTAWTGATTHSSRSTRTPTYGHGSAHPRARPEGAAGQAAVDAETVAVLGQRALLVRPGHHQSCGDGSQRPRLDVVALPPPRKSARVLRTIRRRRSRRGRPASGRSSTSTRSTKQFHQVDTASTRTTCSSRTMPTRRCTATACSAARSAGSTRACSTRPAT